MIKPLTIGILETGRPPEGLEDVHGSYPRMFEALLAGHDFEFQSWPVIDSIFPDGVDSADGWIITGSRHGAYEDHPWIPPLEAFIRDAVSREIPMVGVCFGHQIMAQALGGTVIKHPSGWGLGAQRYYVERVGAVSLNAVHQDQVTALPEGAVIEGRSSFCDIAAASYGNAAWSIQPHPEFSAAFLADLMEARHGVFPAADITAATADLDKPLDAPLIAEKIASVLKFQPSLAATASSANG